MEKKGNYTCRDFCKYICFVIYFVCFPQNSETMQKIKKKYKGNFFFNKKENL